MCDDSIVIPYGILAAISFEIIKGPIVVVDFFDWFIFAPESSISSVMLLGEFGEFPIQFIKLISGLLIQILYVINLTAIRTPFCFFPVSYYSRPLTYGPLSWTIRFYSHEYNCSPNSNSNTSSWSLLGLLELTTKS